MRQDSSVKTILSGYVLDDQSAIPAEVELFYSQPRSDVLCVFLYIYRFGKHASCKGSISITGASRLCERAEQYPLYEV
jgi:hypothetical protein